MTAQSAARLLSGVAGPWSLEDAAEFARTSGHRVEVQEGNLLLMPPPDWDHSKFLGKLRRALEDAGLEYVGADCGVRIPGGARKTGRTPDLVVLRSEPNGRTVWHDPAAVWLVVEIVSDGSQDADHLIKPKEYARAGIPYFWRVERDDDESPMVRRHVLRSDGRYQRELPLSLQKLLTDDGVLAGALTSMRQRHPL